MANFFDKFDDVPQQQPQGNYFDRFSQPVDPGLREYVQGAAGGFNSGLANMAGLPVDIMNMGLSAVGLGSPQPFLGSESIKSMVGAGTELVGVPREAMFSKGPDTPGGRIISRVGEELGASAIPAAGILGAAGRVGQAGLAARAVPQPGLSGAINQRLLAPIAATPVRALVGETVAASGAGLGAGIAGETHPGNKAAELTGQVVGGFAPTVMANLPMSLATRAGRSALSYLSPQGQAKRSTETVKSMVGGELTPEARQRLADALMLKGKMPGFDPTLGEATGSPALIAQQRRLEQEASGINLERVVRRRADAEKAVDQFTATSGPRGDATPDYIVDAARNRVDDVRDRLTRLEGQTEARLGDVATGIPRTERADTGQRLRELGVEVGREERAAMKMVARESGLDDARFALPFEQMRSGLLNAFDSASLIKTETGKRVFVEPGIVKTIRDASNAQSFPGLMEMRSDLSGAIRRAEMSPQTDDAMLRGLYAMKRQFDDQLERAVGLTTDPDIAKRYSDFRTRYHKDIIERFEQGAMYRVTHRDGTGAYVTPNEKVADAFFGADKVSDARQFNSVFRDRPEANAALEAVAMDGLADYAVRDGVISPKRFAEWTRRNAAALDQFPNLKRRVESVRSANDGLLERQAQLAGRREMVENRILSRELKAFDTGAKNGDEVITAALRDPRKMEQLITTIRREPDAVNGLRRNVWERATGGRAEDVLRFTEANRGALEKLLTPEHLKAIEDIASARLMLQRTHTPTGSSIEARPLEAVENLIGQGLPQLSSRIFAFKSGRMQKGYLAVDATMRSLRGKAKQAADDVFNVALYDLDAARVLADTVNTGALTRDGAKRLQARLFALGITVAQEDRPETNAGAGTVAPGDPRFAALGVKTKTAVHPTQLAKVLMQGHDGGQQRNSRREREALVRALMLAQPTQQ